MTGDKYKDPPDVVVARLRATPWVSSHEAADLIERLIVERNAALRVLHDLVADGVLPVDRLHAVEAFLRGDR